MSDDPEKTFQVNGEWLTPRRFAFLLGLLIVAMFPDVLFGSATFFYRDFGFFGYPLAHYHRACFWRGELPLWNPLNDCGLPYLAQWNTMVLYPPSLFYLLFPLSWSLAVFNLLHLFLAGLGMYFLAQRWAGNRLAASVAGVAFAFSGLSLNCLMWPNNIAALGWMPWVIWLVERSWRLGGRHLLAATAVGAVQMLAGGAEIILFTWVIVGALALSALWKHEQPRLFLLARVITVVIAIACLAAAQLFPFFDLLLHSHRDSAFGDSQWAMPRWGLANFLLPLFRTKPGAQGVFFQYGQYWTTSYYVGAGVIMLALPALVRGRSGFFWWGCAAAGLVMSLGDNTYLYDLFHRLIPGLGVMRYPIKFVVLTVFALPLLAAQTVAWFLRLPTEQLRRQGRTLAFITGGSALVVVALVWWAHSSPYPQDDWSATLRNGLMRLLFLLLLAAAVYLARSCSTGWGKALGAFSLLIIIWTDLRGHVPNQNPTVARWVYEPGLVDSLLPAEPRPVLGGSRAMITPIAQHELRFSSIPDPTKQYPSRRVSLLNNVNLLDDIPKVNGFYSLYPPHHATITGMLYAQTNLSMPRLLDFMGVSHITAPSSVFDWQNRASFLPMITAGQKPIFADDDQAVAALGSEQFDPRTEVYLPLTDRVFVNATNRATANILAARSTAHASDIEVVSAQPTLVTVAQTYYHCWRAYVNGVPAPLLRANHAFQAVPIPAGRNHVRLVYEDKWFKYGAIVSTLSVVIWLLVWVTKRAAARPTPA